MHTHYLYWSCCFDLLSIVSILDFSDFHLNLITRLRGFILLSMDSAPSASTDELLVRLGETKSKMIAALLQIVSSQYSKDGTQSASVSQRASS